MPFLSLPSRRDFFPLAFGAAALVRGSALKGQSKSARWAFFADTHIPADPAHVARGFRPHEQLAKVVAQVAGANVRGSLINGDLARLDGQPGDYQSLIKLLEPISSRMPVAMALGNHDHRKNFQIAFSKHPGDVQVVRDRHVTAVSAGPVRLLVLDSLLHPNITPGLLGQNQRAWLERYLSMSDDTPTLVFVHHTPGDGDGALLDTERVLRVLRASRKVKALIFGHSHRYHFDRLDDFHLINLPAVGYNFSDTEPTGWVEVELTAEGADFKLHAIGGNLEGDGKTTSVSWRG
jgi:Icc protein